LLLRPILKPLQKGLFAMGRHSLGVYILHLSLLAVAVLARGKHPFPSPWIWLGAYIVLLAVCEFYALWRERKTAPALRTVSNPVQASKDS
jgi:surface polysaccharide O-acyltransferase-like enzyme